jgi:hypothetical protein
MDAYRAGLILISIQQKYNYSERVRDRVLNKPQLIKEDFADVIEPFLNFTLDFFRISDDRLDELREKATTLLDATSAVLFNIRWLRTVFPDFPSWYESIELADLMAWVLWWCFASHLHGQDSGVAQVTKRTIVAHWHTCHIRECNRQDKQPKQPDKNTAVFLDIKLSALGELIEQKNKLREDLCRLNLEYGIPLLDEAESYINDQLTILPDRAILDRFSIN